MTPHEIASGVSEATGREIAFVRHLVGGETGASEYVDDRGQSLVIKTVTDPDSAHRRREAVVVSERLRLEADWPVPFREAVEGDGCVFVLQHFVPGDAIEHLTGSHVERLLRAHDARQGLGVDDESTAFADHLIDTLLVGGDEYCRHAPLRQHSERGSAFIDRARSIGRALQPSDLSGHDLIHWDLHPGNLIERSGELVGVIDLDHAKVGDGLVDLTMLALCAREPGHSEAVRTATYEAGIDVLDDGRRHAYVAHYTLRFADWAVRRGRADELSFWLDQADELLD